MNYDRLTQNRSVRKQILLTPEMASKLKFTALTKQVSENEIVNKALNAYLARFKENDSADN